MERSHLAKDPHQRFGSVRAFANALEQACTLPCWYHLKDSIRRLCPVRHLFLPLVRLPHLGPLLLLLPPLFP
jgi:hypothetical protein